MAQYQTYDTFIQPYKLLNLEKLAQMNKEYYARKLNAYIQDKTVHILEMDRWDENVLSKWFYDHFDELGFEEIHQETTPQYNKLKEQMKFINFPDYLVKRNGRWLRLEIETLSGRYHHPIGYADILLCYKCTSPPNFENDHNLEIITIRKILGVKEIIIPCEIPAFLYEYDEEFRQDYYSRKTEAERRFEEDYKTSE